MSKMEHQKTLPPIFTDDNIVTFNVSGQFTQVLKRTFKNEPGHPLSKIILGLLENNENSYSKCDVYYKYIDISGRITIFCDMKPESFLKKISDLRNKKDILPGNCNFCKKENAKFTCGQCQKVSYCSPSCQRNDWLNHINSCEKNKCCQGCGSNKNVNTEVTLFFCSQECANTCHL